MRLSKYISRRCGNVRELIGIVYKKMVFNSFYEKGS